MSNIPETIYAEMADMVLMCWDELRFGDMMIQMELGFACALDEKKLRRALELVMDAHPVLGCRAVIHPKRMVWERLRGGNRENLLITSDINEYEAFSRRRLDSTAGPQIKACLLRIGGRDRLLLKAAHQTSDAGGVKEIMEDVADIYSRLEKEPDYTPEPNLTGSRDWEQVYRLIPKTAYLKIFINFLRENLRTLIPYRTFMLPLPEGSKSPPIYILRNLSKERVSALSAYAKERGSTLNDMIATACLRAIAATCGPSTKGHIRLHMTMDLRRWYLGNGRAEAVCNLSSFEFVSLGRNPGRDFDSTLARVSAFMRGRKANWPGLNQAIYLPLYYRLNYTGLSKFFNSVMRFMMKKRNFPNMLTNMGPILPEKISFSGMPPVEAWLLTPPVFPPIFGVGLSGYRGSLTLSAGVPESSKKAVEDFFDRALAELPT